MKENWYGCPNCYLAFSKDTEHRRHFEVDHPKKKFRLAGKIDSAANY
ncbi:MAG TPA: hypothetical protein VGQ03_01570 [Nitrososphaera sp.]|nr:hypothetical protein [Nitrososphaera sp.]